MTAITKETWLNLEGVGHWIMLKHKCGVGYWRGLRWAVFIRLVNLHGSRLYLLRLFSKCRNLFFPPPPFFFDSVMWFCKQPLFPEYVLNWWLFLLAFFSIEFLDRSRFFSNISLYLSLLNVRSFKNCLRLLFSCMHTHSKCFICLQKICPSVYYLISKRGARRRAKQFCSVEFGNC